MLNEYEQNNIDKIDAELGVLFENLLDLNELWAMKEWDISWKNSGIKYPFKLIKRFMRKVIYWVMRPYWQQQEQFNSSVARAVGDIYRIQRLLVDDMQSEYENALWQDEGRVKVIQIVATLNYGDAVGNDVIAIKNALIEQNILTEIYTKNIHKRIAPGTAKLINRIPKLNKNDIVIYHFAAEDPLVDLIKELPCIKILRYHNITPSHFFKGYNAQAERNTSKGLQQIKGLKDYIDYGLVDSEYNKKDLEDMGYACPQFVMPILIQFEDYAKTASEQVIHRYSDGTKNIIFVGRVAPNKKIEDIIEVFQYYHSNCDSNSRLIIVGSYDEKNKYYRMLKKKSDCLEDNSIIFTGHIPFDEILGYYKVADAFLCMSEHEGFCVPLVEAMYFGVPIVAYASTAVPGTLGSCGILVDNKEPSYVANKLRQALDKEKAASLIDGEKERLKFFDNKLIKKQLKEIISSLMQEEK